jgi:hypothetical protein
MVKSFLDEKNGVFSPRIQSILAHFLRYFGDEKERCVCVSLSARAFSTRDVLLRPAPHFM